MRTMLSQNTTDRTSARAFASLKQAFPTWKEFLAAPNAACEGARARARVSVFVLHVFSRP